MIPKRTFPKDLKILLNIVLHNKREITLNDFTACVIVSALEFNRGNRVHTARQLKVPIKTLRGKIKWIEALGYEAPKSECGRRYLVLAY
jgi:transcriptional regulator with AAA-type ATPase domain